MAMMRMMMMIDLGLLVLGVILVAIGAVLTPGVAQPFAFPGSVHETGQSLIAIGFALIVVSVGYLLAGFRERMLAMMAEMGH